MLVSEILAIKGKVLFTVSSNRALSEHPPASVLIVNRGLDPEMAIVAGRDVDYASLRERHLDANVPCEWVESNHPSYILYTSGTTGKPKGVQRDTGGYAVALAASLACSACRPARSAFSCSSCALACFKASSA